MKKGTLISGIFVFLVGVYQCIKYIFDYNNLTSYGKGFVWGSILLIITGMLLILISKRIKK